MTVDPAEPSPRWRSLPASPAQSPENCGACRFWERRREQDGFCKFAAPVPSSGENEIARWRQTHALDWCGDGEKAVSKEPRILCGACRFWNRPGQGIQPVLYGDHFRDWWRKAGHCRRYAPRAIAELGARSFWPVTHEDDSCADGTAKA